MKRLLLCIAFVLSFPIFADFSSNTENTPKGSTVTLSWSSTAASCTGSGAWSGSKAASGTEQVVLPQEGWNLYVLNCGGVWEYLYIWGTAEVSTSETINNASSSSSTSSIGIGGTESSSNSGSGTSSSPNDSSAGSSSSTDSSSDSSSSPNESSAGSSSSTDSSSDSSSSSGSTLPAESLTYSLSGTDASHFTIDQDTGGVSFTSAPSYIYPSDANNDNVYDIKVKVSSGLDNAPPSFGSVTGSSVINEGITSSIYVDENKNSVGSVSVTDSENDNLTYSLSGDDSSYFSISNTGEITLNETLDYETPLDIDGDNVYALTVTVSDGINSVTKDLSINVQDVVEVSDTGDLVINVDENVESFELGLPANATNVRVYTSNGYADDLDGKENVSLGNSDGSVLILSEDTTFSSSDIIKLISDIQLADGVTLSLEGASIYGDKDCKSSSPNTGLSCKDIEVRNGLFIASNAKIRKIDLSYNSNRSTPIGSIQITNSSYIEGYFSFAGNNGYGSYEILDSYFLNVNWDKYFYAWYPRNKFSLKRNIFYNSGNISIGFDSDQLQSEPTISNNIFVYGPSASSFGNWFPSAPVCGRVYICLWASYPRSNDFKLKLEGNAYLSKVSEVEVYAFGAVYDSDDGINSNSEYFGVTNTDDVTEYYLDSSDNLDFASVVVNNPVSEVNTELSPVFHPKIDYQGNNTFKFDFPPDYEAGSRTLNYTVEYTDAGTPKTSTLTITVNDLVD